MGNRIISLLTVVVVLLLFCYMLLQLDVLLVKIDKQAIENEIALLQEQEELNAKHIKRIESNGQQTEYNGRKQLIQEIRNENIELRQKQQKLIEQREIAEKRLKHP